MSEILLKKPLFGVKWMQFIVFPCFSLNDIMRLLPVFFLLPLFFLSGCADRLEVKPAAYGTVVDQLPSLKEADEPFNFPFAGDVDHRNCVFRDEDFL